ncbi:unnamed protein product [Linum tenue]|uniref:Uncharacterized protein n=1 Tax=Linum tenue TaxID=586396 RepID=A0AAV0P4L7_9ROSI|nr:unnamed protein product [Linum tenue]
MMIFDEKTVQVWRDALKKVGAMKGWHVTSNDEQGEIANLVTGDVWSHLSKISNALETDKLIRIDGHIEAVEERMTLESLERSMIEIVFDTEKQKVFRMHDQLRDMGREIVRQENKRHPWNRSRIWLEENDVEMLYNKKRTNTIEGIRMNPSSDDGVVDELEIVANLESECFMNLSELRYLDVQAKMLPSDFTDYLPNLRWLQWKSGNSECLPKFRVENMVILELLTPVKDDWGGLRHLVKVWATV